MAILNLIKFLIGFQLESQGSWCELDYKELMICVRWFYALCTLEVRTYFIISIMLVYRSTVMYRSIHNTHKQWTN